MAAATRITNRIRHNGFKGPRRHLGLFLFAAISLLVSMSLSQTEAFEQGSLQYWVLVLPAALLPLPDLQRIGHTLRGPAQTLLYLVLAAGAWHLARGDARAVTQLALLVFVLAWISIPSAGFKIDDLVALYVVLVLLGIAVNILTSFSPYGILPGRTVEEFGTWRVSFFPNIAYTGILSLAILLVLTKDWATARRHPLVLALAAYFMFFSFVRTALIGFGLYALMRWWLHRQRSRNSTGVFWLTVGVGVGATVLIASSAIVIEAIQQVPYVPELLLQGKSDLSAEEILDQMYRPWLWLKQLELFVTSPSLMGWGTFSFSELAAGDVDPSHIVSEGSEALPTRLLATYGLAGLTFLYYIFSRLRRLAILGDQWACACFPAVFLLLMNWGGVFHPTDALFAIFLMMVVRGNRAFT